MSTVAVRVTITITVASTVTVSGCCAHPECPVSRQALPLLLGHTCMAVNDCLKGWLGLAGVFRAGRRMWTDVQHLT